MKFGRSCPKGFLPVFSVDTEAEAKELILLCCPKDAAGNFYARELTVEQNIENLAAFGDKLSKGYAFLQQQKEEARKRQPFLFPEMNEPDPQPYGDPPPKKKGRKRR